MNTGQPMAEQLNEVRNEVRVVAVPAFADNYLWLMVRHDAAGRRAVVVDPGDAAAIEAALQQHHAKLEAILVTHHHHDHADGIVALARKHAVPVHGPAHENIAALSVRHHDGDDIDVLGLRIKVMEVPGHTAGHLAYYVDANTEPHRPHQPGWLFCGDTLFGAGCGRLLGGTAEQLFASLQRLAALPPSTQVYCGHEYTLANLRFALTVEPDNAALRARAQRCAKQREQGQPTVPSTLGEELATNPFLRCHEPAVRIAVQAHQREDEGANPFANPSANPSPHASTRAIFMALRQWKDTFK